MNKTSFSSKKLERKNSNPIKNLASINVIMLGRRIGKQLMQRNQPKHISWDGDKLVLTERGGTRIHTVYLPHSFVPLLRFEGDKPPTVTPLADKLEQEVGITLPPDFKHALHNIEQALRANRLSAEQHAWLNQVQLSPDYLTTLLDPLPDTPYAAQLYDCNHLGTPQQLINLNGHIDWSITLDAWGNTLSEENPHQLHQPIRMQGQQYDEESGLHYNRHRYYDPTIGRYITQDPIGLRGGLNFYGYPLSPLQFIDPLGLKGLGLGSDGGDRYCQGIGSAYAYLPQEKADQVRRNAETMHNVYNPLNEYVAGIAIGSAIVGIGGIGMSAAPIAEKGAACIEDTVKSVVVEKERDPTTLGITCAKAFINKGSTDFQGKVSDYLIDTLSSYSQKQ
ncbi:RHS repeat-associated core domain-containing protein [Obesumbacterium proteus]|uniref:RHS repeat-associated core domain-containing protein n=1 Tax=Obesumbacterium proteus TaxID=82983 RepID=UPI00187D6AE2|nr:RHS repeat-associated core domain-containing protein [Obesumbacterium proteus]